MQSSQRPNKANNRLMALKVQLDGLDNLSLLYILVRIMIMKHRRAIWLIGMAVALLGLGAVYAATVGNADMALVLGIWIGIAIGILIAILLSNSRG